MGLSWPWPWGRRAGGLDPGPSTGGPRPLLELQDVSKRFGALEAVSGVSLEVEPGEICGLVGPDGAGKTTTLRMAVGLVAPDSGRCLVQGEDLSRGRGVQGVVGYVSQAFSLYGDLSVEENLWFFGRMHGLGRKDFGARSTMLLDITGLAPFRKRRAAALSGGMYKKLALACALLHEPRLLVMDEPTNGVDVVSRHQLWDLVAESASRGAGVLVSTPLMQEAERCHRVYLLAQGRIVLSGRPRELKEHLSGRCWELSSPDPLGLASVLERESWVLGLSVESSDRLRVVVAQGGLSALRRFADEHGLGLGPDAPRLEDVYLMGLVAAQTGGEEAA